jgi:hypothetical protein
MDIREQIDDLLYCPAGGDDNCLYPKSQCKSCPIESNFFSPQEVKEIERELE